MTGNGGYVANIYCTSRNLRNYHFNTQSSKVSIFALGFKSLYPKFIGSKAKGRISKRVFQESKARQIFRRTDISYPLIRTRTQGVRNVCFSGNLPCFAFLKHPLWDSRFCLITDDLSSSYRKSFAISSSRNLQQI